MLYWYWAAVKLRKDFDKAWTGFQKALDQWTKKEVERIDRGSLNR